MPAHHGKSGTSAGVAQGQSSSGGNGYQNVHQTGAVSQTPGRTRGVTSTGNGKSTIDVRKTAENVAIGQGAKLAGVGGPYSLLLAPAVRWLGSKFKRDKSLKTDIKGIRQDPKTGATYHKAPRDRPVIDRGGDGEGGTRMAAASAQAAQPVKPRSLAMKPYYMGFDFQQAKHKLGTSGQLAPDPRKQNYQGWQFKKGGLSGGERFGPPPKKGPNPHGKCPFRPDGIRGVGAVEKGRGVKFIGTK